MSLFTHIGKFSSLPGQIRKIKPPAGKDAIKELEKEGVKHEKPPVKRESLQIWSATKARPNRTRKTKSTKSTTKTAFFGQTRTRKPAEFTCCLKTFIPR
jgi:hypothetical protein